VSESVDLGKDKMNEHCPSGKCIVLINVYCFQDPCEYTLVTSSEEVINLAEGVPHESTISNGQYDHYRFYNDLEDTNILITVTPMSSADPDVYVSKGRGKRPQISESDWSSETWGGEHLLISANDDYFNENTNHTSMVGVYMISVLGYIEGSYIITVTNSIDLIARLYPGQPLNAVNADALQKYFYYFNTRNETVTVSATPHDCAISLAANNMLPIVENMFDRVPTPMNNTWDSNVTHSQNLL
jgi:hypothetical protein